MQTGSSLNSATSFSGQFGWPTFGAGAFVGFLAATFSSIIESIGDYYAAAKICNVPPPPRHSMNRGIASGYYYDTHRAIHYMVRFDESHRDLFL